ncbi:hypothetical protein ANN_19855 [Periplaneta americana]|uniref:Uncharacterized protein n=1 Tax=Periplaneta americana TaxID=6978 RepID=A0ABQ8SBE9_PERAM|nr:hypothetical protein ANN_19855 [Periplaneta americana]
MRLGLCTESYPAFAHIVLRKNPENFNQVICPEPDRTWATWFRGQTRKPLFHRERITMAINFNQMCRLCLVQETQLLPLFLEDGEILEKIISIMPLLKMSDGDGLPMQVCLHCVQQVNTSYKFKLQCENSDITLRQLLSLQTEVIFTRICLFHLHVINRFQAENCGIATVKEESDDDITFEDNSLLYEDIEDHGIQDDINNFNTNNISKFMNESRNSSSDQQNINKEDKTFQRETRIIPISANRKGLCYIRSTRRKYVCNDCGKEFRFQKFLERHMLTHKKVDYKCDICGEEFEFNQALKLHFETHVRRKPFSCTECGQSFSLHLEFKRHMKSHEQSTKYVCDVCGKIFRMQRNLKRHMMVHSGERPHACNICGKKFSLKNNLKIHSVLHTGDKPYSCEECGSCFAQKSNLSTHMKTHTGERPYSCVQCGKSFVRSRHLQMHLICHTGEKSFSCSQCGKSFGRRDGLQKHISTHTGHRPYLCPSCGKGFAKSSQLKVHVTTHTDNKPFMCTECGKTFARKDRLNDHLTSHSGKRRFSCEYCGKGFVRREHLKYHLNSTHGK